MYLSVLFYPNLTFSFDIRIINSPETQNLLTFFFAIYDKNGFDAAASGFNHGAMLLLLLVF